MLKWSFLCFSVCLLPPVLSLDAIKNLVLSAFLPPIRYLYTLIRYSLTLLFSRVNNSTSFSFFLYDRCFRPLIISVALYWACSAMFMSLVLGSPVLDTAFQAGSHQCWAEWKDHLPQPASNALPPRVLEAICLLHHKGTLLAHVQPECLDPFLQRGFQASWHPACTGVWGSSTLGAEFNIPLCWISLVHFFRLSGSLWWQHNHLVC